jgi:signal transduction histidine kinase
LGLIHIAKIDGLDNPEQNLQYLGMIKKSIDKLDGTIKEMLDYSQNARIDVSYSAVDIRKLVDECLQKLEYLNEFSRVHTELTITGGPNVFTDKHRLTIVLTGLLSNAIRFSDPDKSEPYIKVSMQTTPRQLSIEIEDNGIGIRKQSLPMVFDMFYRGTEVSDGAGLGLFIIKEIADKLGATVSLTSTFEKGTTVFMKIPNHSPNE